MASRPVFVINDHSPYFSEELVSFQFYSGFSLSQKQKNIHSIHDAFQSQHREARILEISSKSDVPLGVQLSAFNLKVEAGNGLVSLESAFQSSKVFQYGGPYTDLLMQPAYIAKKDPRLHESGPLRQFAFNGIEFPLEPKTFFYDWLYVNAVVQNNDLSADLCKYNAFTDIEFNPAKSINCQARSAAIFVSLTQAGLLNKALIDPESFKNIVYAININPNLEQLTLF